MHSGLAAGWSGAITFYELITLDPTDPVYNPIWRQGCYGIPFISRLGEDLILFTILFRVGH